MSEAPAGMGMGPDEPVGSSRSNHRNRNMFILGGLALVLVAGVVFAGVIPSGDRAGTTASESASTSTSATEEQSADATTDPSSTSSPTSSTTATTAPPSPSTTVEVATCADGGACALGDIGPGGGLVFYNAGSAQSWGQYLEMAPVAWSGGSADSTRWCDSSYLIAEPFGTDIGTGAQNTIWMDDGCTSGAGQSAADYVGGGFTDWFLPSKDELNAMYDYKNSIVDITTYRLPRNSYWSSSQYTAGTAWSQYFSTGGQTGNQANDYKTTTLQVRPIRAF